MSSRISIISLKNCSLLVNKIVETTGLRGEDAQRFGKEITSKLTTYGAREVTRKLEEGDVVTGKALRKNVEDQVRMYELEPAVKKTAEVAGKGVEGKVDLKAEMDETTVGNLARAIGNSVAAAIRGEKMTDNMGMTVIDLK